MCDQIHCEGLPSEVGRAFFSWKQFALWRRVVQNREATATAGGTTDKHTRRLPRGAIIGQMFYYNAASRRRRRFSLVFFSTQHKENQWVKIQAHGSFLVLIPTTESRPLLKQIRMFHSAISPEVIWQQSKVFLLTTD